MIAKYCLPIIKTTKQEVLQALNTKGYDFYEVWLDYIKDLDEKFVISLANKFKDKLIFVFRRQNLEEMNSSFEQRIEILLSLKSFQALVDLDIDTHKKELDYIQKQGLGILQVVSYHNYQQTPDELILKEITLQMAQYKPAIYKISTICNDENDALRLLQLLLQLRKKQLKYIILGMGKFGIITRIFGTLWGNEMIFAPKEKDEQSAPGQLTKRELESIFDILGE